MNEPMTGERFNKVYSHLKIVKLTDNNNSKNDAQYKDGLNISNNATSRSNDENHWIQCCFNRDFRCWLKCDDINMINIWDVIVPNDAKVTVSHNKIMVDRLILSNARSLLSETFWLEELEKDCEVLCDVPAQFKTIELCTKIVRRDPLCLRYVPNELRTITLCLIAARLDGFAIRYVPEGLINNELCEEAVKNNGGAYQYIPEQSKTYNISLIAVQTDKWVLEFVPIKFRTTALCTEAVKNNGQVLCNVPDNIMTRSLCIEAVKQCGWCLRSVPRKYLTLDMCLIAVDQYKETWKNVPKELRDDLNELINKHKEAKD